MYAWITHTWNPIRGKCPHDCSYCYMKRFPQKRMRLEEKEFNQDLGEGKCIFIGSSTDMFADVVPTAYIIAVLEYCNKFPENTYLFQSKNPKRMQSIAFTFPPKTIFGTTLETNRDLKVSKAPTPIDRTRAMYGLSRIMISVEPVMDFDLDVFFEMLSSLEPEFVSIGADSGGHNLPEPSPKKLKALIEKLRGVTEVRIKSNLNRILERKV